MSGKYKYTLNYTCFGQWMRQVMSMAQLTIYLDERTQKKAKLAAQRANCSLSRWARDQLNAAADRGQAWPKGYFDLFGSIQDASFDSVSPQGSVEDAPREEL